MDRKLMPINRISAYYRSRLDRPRTDQEFDTTYGHPTVGSRLVRLDERPNLSAVRQRYVTMACSALLVCFVGWCIWRASRIYFLLENTK